MSSQYHYLKYIVNREIIKNIIFSLFTVTILCNFVNSIESGQYLFDVNNYENLTNHYVINDGLMVPQPEINFDSDCYWNWNMDINGQFCRREVIDDEFVNVDEVKSFNILFIPSSLDFKERTTCSRSFENFTIVNNDTNDDLIITSIMSGNRDFDVSLFRKTTIRPKENLTITVSYQPTSLGRADDKLVVITSYGTFIYEVKGFGIKNLYNTPALINSKVPVGVVYKNDIKLYNPYNEVLSIKEIYTSGGYFRVSLPGEPIVPNQPQSFYYNNTSLWDLKPDETKNVIEVKFRSLKTGKFQGYLHIITTKDNLTVPLIMEVIKNNIQLFPDPITFSQIPVGSKLYTDLYVINSKDSDIVISKIIINSTEGFTICQFTPVTVSPMRHSFISKILFNPSKVGVYEGKILVFTSHGQIEASYRAEVIDTFLDYDKESTFIFKPSNLNTDDERLNNIRNITFTNKSQHPLTIYKIDISDLNYNIEKFNINAIIHPGASWPPIKLEYIGEDAVTYTTQLNLYTNLSQLTIPLNVYDGKLSYSIQTENYLSFFESKDMYVLDLGIVKSFMPIELFVNIININPVDIDLVNIYSKEDWIGISINNASIIDNEIVTLKPNENCKLKIEIMGTNIEYMSGFVYIQSSYEEKILKISFRTINKSITLSNSYIDLTQTNSHKIYIENPFDRPVIVHNIDFNDPLFHINESKDLLKANRQNELGNIIFDNIWKGDTNLEKFICRKVIMYITTNFPSKERFDLDIKIPYISILKNQSVVFEESSLEGNVQLYNPLNVPIKVRASMNESHNFYVHNEALNEFVIQPNDTYLFGPIFLESNKSNASIEYGRIMFNNNFTQTEYVYLVGKTHKNSLTVSDGLNNDLLVFVINEEELKNIKQSHHVLNQFTRIVHIINQDNIPITVHDIKFEDITDNKKIDSNIIFSVESFPQVIEPNHKYDLELQLVPVFNAPIIHKKMIIVSENYNFNFNIEIQNPHYHVMYDRIGGFKDVHHQALKISFKFRFILIAILVSFIFIGIIVAIRIENQKKALDKLSLEVKSKNHKSNKKKCVPFTRKKNKVTKRNDCSLKSLFERSKSDSDSNINVKDLSDKENHSLSTDETAILMKNPYYFNEDNKFQGENFPSQKTNIQTKFKPQKLFNKDKENYKHLSHNEKRDYTTKSYKRKSYGKNIPFKRHSNARKDETPKQLRKRSFSHPKTSSSGLKRLKIPNDVSPISNHIDPPINHASPKQENHFIQMNNEISINNEFISKDDNTIIKKDQRKEKSSVGVIGSGLSDFRKAADEEQTYQLFSPYKPNQNQSYTPFLSSYSNLFTDPKKEDIWNHFSNK